MTKQQVVEDARRVLQLLDGGKAWCQCAYARDEIGQRVTAYSPDAASWCVTGACQRVCDDQDNQDELLTQIRRHLPDPDAGISSVVCTWNDRAGRTWPEIERVLTLVITELLRAAELAEESKL